MMAKRLLLLALTIGALSAGCGAATSDYMRPVAGPEPVGAPPNKARVVFVRPSGGAWKVIFTIIDERGYFLGDSTAKGRFSVFLDPGDHYFIVWTETTERPTTRAAARTDETITENFILSPFQYPETNVRMTAGLGIQCPPFFSTLDFPDRHLCPGTL